jgi:hypothetical protein
LFFAINGNYANFVSSLSFADPHIGAKMLVSKAVDIGIYSGIVDFQVLHGSPALI